MAGRPLRPDLPFVIDLEPGPAPGHATRTPRADRQRLQEHRARYERARTVVVPRSLWHGVLARHRLEAEHAPEAEPPASIPERAQPLVPSPWITPGAPPPAVRTRNVAQLEPGAGRAAFARAPGRAGHAGAAALTRAPGSAGHPGAREPACWPAPPPVSLTMQLPRLQPSRALPLAGLMAIGFGLVMLAWGMARAWPTDIGPAVHAFVQAGARAHAPEALAASPLPGDRPSMPDASP